MSITLVIEDQRWRKTRGIQARLKRAVQAALAAGRVPEGGVTLLLTTDKRVQVLNRDFRGKDAPTNVLSFPAGPDELERENYFGDIAVAYGVAAKEAKASNKTLIDHATHLTVHGVLHLLGFDHMTARDAAKMEALEVRILKTFKIADPYSITAKDES